MTVYLTFTCYKPFPKDAKTIKHSLSKEKLCSNYKNRKETKRNSLNNVKINKHGETIQRKLKLSNLRKKHVPSWHYT